jgi:hypothetical protein
MKHFLRLSALSLLITALTLSNCGKESDPGPKTKVEFKLTASSAQEGQNVTVEFSVPLPSGVSVTTANISLSGTATETTDYTYTISNTGITFSLIDDGLYDPDETIVVTLLSVGGNGELGTTLVHTVTITETPLVIGLQQTATTRVEGVASNILFTQPLPEGVTPAYTLGGTATLDIDYTITLFNDRFLIAVLTDEIYDPAETIILTLTGFTGNVVLGTNTTHTVTITDEDDAPGTLSARLKIDLSWETEDGTAGDVDMDLLVWRETSPGVYSAQGGLWSASPGTGFESTSISALETDGNWAFSYVYWGGSSDDLKVKVDFRSHRGNLSLAAGGVSNRASFSADYTAANKNEYPDSYTSPDVVAQTLVKAGSNYNEVSIITVEESGSRTKPLKFILDDEARRIIEKKFQRKAE